MCPSYSCVQEPLKVVGLVSSLQVEEEIAGRERQLNALLEDKKTLKVPMKFPCLSRKLATRVPPFLICRPNSQL